MLEAILRSARLVNVRALRRAKEEPTHLDPVIDDPPAAMRATWGNFIKGTLEAVKEAHLAVGLHPAGRAIFITAYHAAFQRIIHRVTISG
jgi:hypothetical protein